MDPLLTLFDEAPGEALPLPPELGALYGPLRMRSRPDRPHVFANFVASLDGIVAVDPPNGGGAEINGGNPQDLAVMGLLRSVADAVIIGAGNLRAEGNHVWTGEYVCPELAEPYARLRTALGKVAAPLQVVVSGSGDLDLSRTVFSGSVPAVVVTTGAGRERLRAKRPTVRTAVADATDGWLSLDAVLDAVRVGSGALVLVGRPSEPVTFGLVEGGFFRPGVVRGRLLSARRRGDHLFVRYGFRP
jgi:riboflavin biosynthesis pyrimidine reductase